MKKLITLLSLLLFSCTQNDKVTEIPQEQPPQKQIRIRAVKSVPLRVIGQVEHSFSNQYRLPITGMIDSIYVKKADTINSGDTLLSLRHENIQAAERLQRVILSAAKKDRNRTNTLFQKGARTALEKEKAEQRYQLELARINKLRAEKDQQYLRAVRAGVVTSVSTSSGAYVKASDTLLEIQSGNQVIAFNIPHVWSQINFKDPNITALFPGDTLIKLTEISVDSSAKDQIRITSPVVLKNKRGMKCAVTIHSEVENVYLISDFNTEAFFAGDLITVNSSDGDEVICRILSAHNNTLYVQGDFESHIKIIESIKHF